MKNLIALAVTAIALAAFTTTSFAGKCCPADGDKDQGKSKEKVEEGAPS